LDINRVRAGSGWEHLLEIARMEGLDRAYTWNPCIGCRGIGCEVRRRGKCWAERIARRFGWDFSPHAVPERMWEPREVKVSSVITPVSMGDLFGQRKEDIFMVLWVISECKWHVFAILTKLPQHALELHPKYPSNVWFGVTVNTQADVWRLEALEKIEAPKKYCLFEPLYGPIEYDLSWLDLIVIGPQSYPTVQPDPSWVKSVVDRAGGARVFFKSNLRVVL
jgi:protein gp37